MPIIKSTLQAAQNYADFTKPQKTRHVVTLVPGDNEVTQKQLDTLKTLSVFKSQIKSGALTIADAKVDAARAKAEQEAKEKAEQEAVAQKLLDDAAALANNTEAK